MVVEGEEPGVRLGIVADTEFHEQLVLDRHARQQELDHAVLAILGEHAEFMCIQVVARVGRDLACLDPADCLGQTVEAIEPYQHLT